MGGHAGDVRQRLAPGTAAWLDGVAERLRAVEADAVGRTVIVEVLGEGVWPLLPEELREILTSNGPALLAEVLDTRA